MNSIKNVIHKWSWTILITFCTAGIFFPSIGVIALICMLAPVIVSFFKGRLWCGNFCPRGSLNDIVVSKISKKLHVPELLKNKWFKLMFLILLLGGFTAQIIISWGSIQAVGAVFVRMILITTVIAVVLGTIFNQRTWCTICPMGTLASYVAKIKPVNKRINHITFEAQKCISCKMCSNNCPIGIDVLKYKSAGKVTDANCLKCRVCVEKCPKDSLHIS